MFLKLFANCILTKGANQAILFDLQRENYTIIPFEVFDFITNNEGLTIDKIKDNYENKFNNEVEEYINFLLDNEFVFFTEFPEFFPKINTEFHYPFPISNAILEFNNINYIENVLLQLNELKCKNIDLRFDLEISYLEINNILEYLDKIDSNICNINIYLSKEKSIPQEKIKDLLRNPRITSFIINVDKISSKIEYISDSKYIFYDFNNDFNNNKCGLINRDYFAINLNNYTESLNHNSCLNKKISIDKEGNIKNCPSMLQSFGNIKDTTLEEALNHSDFKKYWNVTKDRIEVCKDCEFRHICTDCRAYTERNHFDGDIDLSKPLKCGYNPYTNEWAEWSTNPLKEKAIEFYGMQHLVKTNN
jgi:SPASM domain peptide maturase of grasp-with-spasm system